MEKQWKVKSDFCGSDIDNNLYTEDEAKKIAYEATLSAIKIGFPEVTYSVYSTNPAPADKTEEG